MKIESDPNCPVISLSRPQRSACIPAAVQQTPGCRIAASAFPPYAGSVQPDGLLSAFDGEQAKGGWSLVLLNSNFPDTATLVCWQLQIKPEKTTQKHKKKNHK